ncbi:SAM-dependent methyltransferase PA0798 (UbiE paralog) [Olavius sp. associated proteobacterium Delta 1]|nr:SAM-dependent methyltransferase PA0798 (UbiE paralog) [Olavius sp. associated proteobacterium Delta 1]
MGFYAKYVLPRIAHFVCSSKLITQQRKKVVPRARGRVLEIGIGSGLNLPFYDPEKVRHVWGLDPNEDMWNLNSSHSVSFDVEFLQASAEKIPLVDDSADSIVVTYTLCSVPKTIEALQDMRRVLRPGGELIFCEHGAAPEQRVRRWQKRLNPIWQKAAGGCRLNLQIPTLLKQGGFKIRALDTMYIQGMKFASFNYWGTAVSATA